MEEFELLANSSGLKDLLTSLLNDDKDSFQRILENENDLNLDYTFGDPHLGTLLDLCCMKPGNHLFVDLLLSHGADPNKYNTVRKKAPIHFAVLNNDINTLNALLNCHKTNVNLLDSRGCSALHYAVELSSSDILERLLECKDIRFEINKKGKSPLLCALELQNPNKHFVLAILKHENLQLYDDPKVDEIEEHLNKLIPDWDSNINTNNTDISFSHAFNLLCNCKYERFISVIKSKKDDKIFLEGNNGSHTFLQYCCEYGIPNFVVSELLQLNVNPNKTCNKKDRTPLMTAAYKGYVEIVRMLLKTGKCIFSPVEKETVLHCVVKGSSSHADLIESHSERNHLECLTLLLAAPRENLNINQGDFKGNTALHYATKQGENEMVLLLLKAGASLSCFNFLDEPSFADINFKTLKTYLDSCIYTNDKLPREESYEIILNYGCLRPISNDLKNLHINKTDSSESLSFNNSYNTFESKALLYMAQNNDLKHILKHPIITSFLYLKWCKIKKGFYANLLFYLTFVILMSVYILNFYQDINNDESQISRVERYSLWLLLVFLLVILILRESSQFIISPLKYAMSFENWLEIGIIYSCIMIIFFAKNTSFDDKVMYSVINIMLSWGELVLLIGRHPHFSTYIEMLKTVSGNFLKFLAWYFFLIIAFSLSFHILFGMDRCSYRIENGTECALKEDSDDAGKLFFSSPYISVFKTIIMLTGEFEAASVPFVSHPGLSHILFIAFLFFIAIVLFNLLNGLAVSDTHAIQSDSELVSYIARVKLIAYVETLVSDPLPKKESVFNLNMSSCWETSFLTYCKNRLISKYINFFEDKCLSEDWEIRISPFYGNQIQMPHSTCASNRKDFDQNYNCYKKCGLKEMDSTVVHSIKVVLLEKHVEEETKQAERKKEEKEKSFFEMIKNCNESLNIVKQAVNENKAMLDKLSKIINGGLNP